MPVHETAREGFGTGGANYEKGRPDYPPDAVTFLLQRLGLIGGTFTVADVAAGTGKFTRALMNAGVTPVAVEPVAHMRETFAATTPDALVVDGTAEVLPFADASLDAVLAAQAFHWFDAAAALREFRRVLRPRGGVGLVWNGTDRTVDWVDAIWAEIDAARDGTPSGWTNEWKAPFVAGNGFSPLMTAMFRHDQDTDRDGLVARVTSISFVSSGPEAQRQRLAAHVARVCDDAGLRQRFSMPYNCLVYWCHAV